MKFGIFYELQLPRPWKQDDEHRLYQRYPGVEGSIYFVAGIGVNYLRSDGVTLAPMRTGVGLRAGVNAQYQEYTEERDWFPF